MAPYQTEYVYLKGKAFWVEHIKPSEHKDWRFILYPDKDSLDIIRGLMDRGLMNTLKKDEDGYHMRFRRKTERPFKRNGTFSLTPPVVMMEDGTPIMNSLIGNGSDVTVKLEVYKFPRVGYGQAVATRWESMTVHNLIPYEGARDMTPAQTYQYRGMAEQPKPDF